jgi:hypothetical protein
VPFGEALAEESVGVLIARALPRGFRVTGVDLDAGIDRELCVLGHLFALVPRQRRPEMFGEAPDRGRQRCADGWGGVVIGEAEQHHVPGVAFDERPDRSLVLPHDQVPTVQGGRQWWPSTVAGVLKSAELDRAVW